MKTGAPGSRRALLPDQSGSGGSGHTLTASRQPGHALDALPSKRVCFYKSGDPQFGGLRMVINRRTFKSFEALLDGLSKKVPLPFGVRNIATPRGVHAVRTLDQLEDGKSYVCSDTRKVKPVDLARARKKLAPWYNARPGTGRRKAVRGGGARPWRQEHEAVSAVQKLTVFRNGEPAVSHAVTLKKRSFEALLELLSELLQLPVVKLHTVDGKRVDGLPGLLLCSGRVVAAGQEPFRPGNYNPQSSPTPKWPSAKRQGPRKRRPMHRNKKSVTSASKSRNNSESSQRYFLNQIHNSISESMCDYPSYPTDSMEPENGHMPGSVEPCPDHGTHEQGSYLPKEDDIEKSFRVNQDGSMTVEMKVRLTLKEEETIHWTTTLSRSSVANQLLPECFPTPEPEAGSELEQESDSHDPDHPEPPHSMVPIESTSNDKPRGDDCGNNASSEEGNKEDEVMVKTDNVMSPRRAATPGFRKAKTATDSMRGNTAEEVQEGTVRSYSYRAETERYRMVQQSSTRPVPKPRRMASMDVNYRLNQAEFNSAGMSEVLQIENDGEEVTETVLHIYEQQNCQENFYANTHHHAQGVSMHGALYGRPSTSNSAWSMNADVEPQFGRPSTASESIHTWRADSMLPSSNFPLCKSLVINTQKKGFTTTKDASQLSPETRKDKHHRNVADQANTTSNRKAIKKHVRWIKSPANGRKRSPAEASKNRKKIKPFSSTGFLKKIYGGPPRPVKTTLRKKKTSTEKEQVRSAPRGVPVECTMKDPNTGDEKKQETIPFESNMLEVSPKPRATLTHQKSIHEERQTQRASSEVNRAMALPVFNSSSSIINEYVEHWLGNSPSQHELCPSDKAFNVIDQVGLEGGVPEGSEVSCERIKAGHTEGETEMQSNCAEYPMAKSLTTQRIKTLQSVPPLERTTECGSSTDNISRHINNTEQWDTKQTPKDTSVSSSAMLYTLSSTSSQTSTDRPISVSPTADKGPSPTDHPQKTSISSLSAEREEPLSRKSSVKKARLVSNLSFERKMSQRKASAENSALTRDDPLQTTTSSIPIRTADSDTLESNPLMSIKTEEPTEMILERPLHTDCILDQTSMTSSLSYCTSVSPVSSSYERVSSSSLASSDASYIAKHPAKESDAIKTQFLSSTQTETLSPKPFTKKVKVSDLSLEKKLSIRRARYEASAIPNDPPVEEIPVSNSPSLKRTKLPRNQSLKSAKTGSPSGESPSSLHKTYSHKKTSPYSQSLDLVSPPVKQRTKNNLIHRNILPDKGSEVTNQTPELPEVPHRSRLQNELSEESPVVLEPDSSDRIERTERDDRGSAEASATAKPSDNNVPTNSEEGHVNSSDCVEKALVDVKAIVKLFTDPENPEGAHEKPSKPKQQNLSDDQKAVHTPLNTHNEEDSTTDLADTVSLREEQLPIPASQVSTEDKELESGNHRVEEEEVEQCSLNENQPIKSHVPYMDLEETTEESHDENRCSSEGEHLEGESKELDRNSDDSMFSPEELSSSDEERKHILSTEGHHRNICNPGTQKKLSSPKEQRDIELRQLKRVRNNNMSDYKSLSSSEEEEQRLQCTDRFKCSSVTISSTQETSRSVHILPPVDKQIRHKLTKIESLSERSEENRSTPDTEQLVHLEKYQPQVHKPEHQLSCTEATSNPVCKAVELDCKQHIYQDQTFRSRSHPDQPTLSIDSCMGENINGERSSSSRDVAEQSEEGHDDRCNQEQNIHGTPSPEDTSAQRAAPQQKAEPAEIPSQSVAERIGILKKQVADTQWKSNTAGGVGIQILADVASSDVPESPTPDTKMTRALPGSRSAPQSSLSFSYDSSGIPTRQSDGATVQSIKEMFMAKSVPDVLREDRGVHRPISSEHSPASRSQHWDELSEARSIAKGFVRKTIERLYGKKDSTTGDTPSGRHTSSPKHLSIFSSLDAAQSKLRTDMPYFNSTDTLNMSSEVRRCKAFNMQVGPDDSLPTDRDRSLIRKSTSDPAGINKVVETPLLDIDPLEDTRQKVPVSLFSTTSEPEDKLVATKCTYFSLPCASDSEPGLEDPGLKEPGHEDPGLKEPGHEDPGAVSKNRKSSVDIKEEQEEAKDWAERSGTRPGLRLHDNKVQPLTQGTPGGQVVVVQPIRGQGVVHRPMELDALDALYTFCGEHCPIL